MTIGEKIIAEIVKAELFKITDNTRNAWSDDCVVVWSQSAEDQLNALVAAHVEEQVRLRLEDRVRNAVNMSCTCGGNPLGACCSACEVWHTLKNFDHPPIKPAEYPAD